MAKMAKEEACGEIIAIPGTKYGFRWENVARWVLYEWVQREKRTDEGKAGSGVFYEEWANPCFPVNFAHMAKIVMDGTGKGAKTLHDLLNQTVAERERLQGVLEEIIQQSAPPR